MRERHHAMRSLLDAAPAMLWTADAQGRTTYTSPRWSAFTGISAADALGRGWADAVHAEDRERMVALIDSRSCFATEFTAEYRLRRADGEYRWILDQGVPRYAPDGSIEGYIGCCVDIHARVVAERRLRRQTAAYEVLTDVNEAIARVRDGPALMQRVCDSIVAYGGMNAAWVGLVDPERRTPRSVSLRRPDRRRTRRPVRGAAEPRASGRHAELRALHGGDSGWSATTARPPFRRRSSRRLGGAADPLVVLAADPRGRRSRRAALGLRVDVDVFDEDLGKHVTERRRQNSNITKQEKRRGRA